MRILILFLLLSATVSAQPVLVSGGKLTSAGSAVNQFLGWDGSEFIPKTVPSFWIDNSGNPADATTDETDIIKRNGDVFCKKLIVHNFNSEYPSPSASTTYPILPNTSGINFSVGQGSNFTEFVGMSLWPLSVGLKGLVMGGNTTNMTAANGGMHLILVSEKTDGTNYISPAVGEVVARIGFSTSTGSGVTQSTYGYGQSESGLLISAAKDATFTSTDNGYSTSLWYNGLGLDNSFNVAGSGKYEAIKLSSDGYIKFPQYSRTAAQDTQVVTQFFGLARYATDNKMVRKNISDIPNFGNTNLTVGANRSHTVTDVVSFKRTAVQSVPVVNIESVENGSGLANLLKLTNTTGGEELSFYHDGTNGLSVIETNQDLRVSSYAMTLEPQSVLNLGTTATRTNNFGAQNYETTVTSPATLSVYTDIPIWYVQNGTTTINFPEIVNTPSTGEAKIGDEITLIINGNTSAVTINPGSGDDFYITNGSGTSASDSNAANNNYFKIFKAISLTSWAVK